MLESGTLGTKGNTQVGLLLENLFDVVLYWMVHSIAVGAQGQRSDRFWDCDDSFDVGFWLGGWFNVGFWLGDLFVGPCHQRQHPV